MYYCLLYILLSVWLRFQLVFCCYSSVTVEGEDYYYTEPQWTEYPTHEPFREAISKSPLEELLGSDVKKEPYNSDLFGNKGGLAGEDLRALDCNFDYKDCCYTNAGPPHDELEWIVAQGDVDAEKIKENFGTTISPTGKFLIVLSPGPEISDARAIFSSCSIGCTNDEVTVRFRHWTTSEVNLRVCSKESLNDEAELENCADVEHDASAGPAEITLPANENFDVVIVAEQFSSHRPNAAIIDDIEVDYVLCGDGSTTEETTPSSTTSASTESGEQTTETDSSEETTTESERTTEDSNENKQQDSGEECNTIPCDFENGAIFLKVYVCPYISSVLCYLCEGYNDLSLAEKVPEAVTNGFEVVHGKFQNLLTGIRGASDGDYYAATYLHPGEKAAMIVNAKFRSERIVRFMSYEATHGIGLRACCGSERRCPYSSSAFDIAPTDMAWRTASFICPASEQLLFVCENNGLQIGACGIDKIELYKVDDKFNDPSNAFNNLCK